MRSPRLTTQLLRKIFVAASIRRWNDQATPIEFCELDKQAHKIIIAYFLAKLEEERHKKTIDWEKLIEQFCFEFFERITLTDIKPPVFHELVKKHNSAIVGFVMDSLKDELKEYEFYVRMREYLLTRNDNKSIEKNILQAAHYYASKWEFDIIYKFNPHMFDVKNIKQKIDEQVEEHYDLAGMRELVLFKERHELITMLGQLRFQKRWSRTPRIPATSVLGHMLVVALSAYLFSLDMDACEQMRINHFLCGLFHDLPEVLTRDIITPIKHNINGLDSLIKDIERRAVKDKINSKIPPNIALDINYFTQNEFTNRYQIEGFEHVGRLEEIFSTYNENKFNPICGEFLKFCDNLGAFLEAGISIEHGISSTELIEGAKNIYEKCKDKNFNDVNVGKILRDFKQECKILKLP